jgi:serine O-acetyltransferase
MKTDLHGQQVILRVTEQLTDIGSSGGTLLENCPDMKDRVVQFISLVRGAMYPTVFGAVSRRSGYSSIAVSYNLQRASETLNRLLKTVLPDRDDVDELVLSFLEKLPDVKRQLETDIRAAYDGDPAAVSTEEVMLAYPAFEAISIFRLAHVLFTMSIPVLPRIMTEYAHQITGIDIHPGATIGDYFFIDHGTGVVIGETTTIGHHVKLYQGVTLGARSFELDENGNPVKGIKRHPDIGDHVIIYSGATILGGNTRIGDRCVIGGNVWLTHSVEAGKTVLAAEERGMKIV